MTKDVLLSLIVASVLFAVMLASGMYYWLQFLNLCPTGCGL